MGQAPTQLTPLASPLHFLGAELRHWRQRRSMSQAQLGKAVHASADLIGKVEKATRCPTRDFIGRCDGVLDTGGALARLLTFAEQHRAINTAPNTHRAESQIVVVVGPELLTQLLTQPTPSHVADLHSDPTIGTAEEVATTLARVVQQEPLTSSTTDLINL